MKTLLLCLCPLWAFTQITVTDSFTDGNFHTDPPWIGTDSLFEISSGELHLNAGNAGEAYLFSQSEISNRAEWQFYIRLEFNPSSSNFAKVYLMADNKYPDSLNAYYVRIGGSADDKLSLYRQNGSDTQLLIESHEDYLDLGMVEIYVKVKRDSMGFWTLQSDTGNFSNAMITHGTVRDTLLQRSSYGGLYCEYTSTRADRFYFDDFYFSGYPYVDSIAPRIDSIKVLKSDLIKLYWNEEPDAISVENTANYEIIPEIKLRRSTMEGKRETSLHLSDKLESGRPYTLQIQSVSDLAGNTGSYTLDFDVSDRAPFVDLVHMEREGELEIMFSETIVPSHSDWLSCFSLDNGVKVEKAQIDTSDTRKIHLKFSESIDEGVLIIQNIEDLFGNEWRDTLSFSLREHAVKEGFSDGDLSKDPEWSGNNEDFIINEDQKLQLSAEEEGASYLSFQSTIEGDAYWYFCTDILFNPSSSNFARFYLTSDHPDLNGALNGYYIQIGSGEDRIGLYRQTGKVMTPLIEGDENTTDVHAVKARIMVRRGKDGLWTLKLDTGLLADPMKTIGEIVDTMHRGSFFSGIWAQYTSTRSDKIYFDDIYLSGNAYSDKEKPRIDSLQVSNDTTLEVVFSEAVTEASSEDISHYILDDHIMPLSVKRSEDHSHKVKLYFHRAFEQRKTYRIRIEGVKDLYGNRANDSGEFVFFIPKEGDIVLNEIMADPSPIAGSLSEALPEAEYVELYNRTGFDIILRDWILAVSGKNYSIPAFLLPVGSYVVLTNENNKHLFRSRGISVIGLDISAMALNNGGTSVALISPEDKVISVVNYTESWYGNPDKSGGGWSLERTDPDNLCGGKDNWQVSISSNGGTPAEVNSVMAPNPDTTSPLIKRWSLLGDTAFELYFSKYIKAESLHEKENYNFHPTLSIKNIRPRFPDFTSVLVILDSPLSRDSIYKFWFDNAPVDCSGNALKSDTLDLALPAAPMVGDILVNEILFDPHTGGSDFVELYNNSQKFFDLKDLRLANYDPIRKGVVNMVEISRESYIFSPGTYIALSRDVEHLRSNYVIKDPLALIKTPESLPSMPDDEGSIAIADNGLNCIDYFQYEDDDHLPFIQDAEGVSLERISFDEENWQSAASTASYGTPGYKNSQYFTPSGRAQISVEPKVFSPDQNGYKDIVTLGYKFEKPNNILSVTIYNSEGNQIRELIDNHTVETKGFVKWDGTNEDGERMNTGIYIVLFDFFHEDGTNSVVKETCVLSL